MIRNELQKLFSPLHIIILTVILAIKLCVSVMPYTVHVPYSKAVYREYMRELAGQTAAEFQSCPPSMEYSPSMNIYGVLKSTVSCATVSASTPTAMHISDMSKTIIDVSNLLFKDLNTFHRRHFYHIFI